MISGQAASLRQARRRGWVQPGLRRVFRVAVLMCQARLCVAARWGVLVVCPVLLCAVLVLARLYPDCHFCPGQLHCPWPPRAKPRRPLQQRSQND